jgi:copper chaperone CopZ
MFQIIPRRALTVPAVRVDSIEGYGEGISVTLRVDGLLCSLCAANVERRLRRVDGVSDAHVNLRSGEATVQCESNTDTENLLAAVESAVVLRPVRQLVARLRRAAA